ncbi:hypothetical protein [Streptomyces hydrogenans]|uniref:hypothetical protein n=1 Tax=Streptomyces hydrogenans TaxID=1873719 RepID=UPI0035D881E9
MNDNHITAGRVFAACHPEDTARLRIVQYEPGDLRALVADAETGARRRLILASSLHASPLTTGGAQRRSGYAPEDAGLGDDASVAELQQPAAGEVDWFEGLPGRRFRVALPPRLTLLNANERPHHHRRAEITRVLRRAAAVASRHVPHLERAHLIGVLHPPTRGRRDPANWYPSFKAVTDGLVDQGVLDDDDHTRVLGPDMRLGHVVAGARLVLHIRALTMPNTAGEQGN